MPLPLQPDDGSHLRPVASVAVQTADPEDFKRRLTDEYKILQDKIDKIGAFRFTIKGWSVTAVIAATAAASTAKSILTAGTVSMGLAAMLLFFFLLEVEQVRLSWLFGNRARRLEDAFIRIDRPRGKLQRPFPVPFIANEIVRAGRRAQGARSANPPRTAMWWSAHIYFYAVLLFLAFIPLVPRYHQIGMHLGQWVNGLHTFSAGTSKSEVTGKK